MTTKALKKQLAAAIAMVLVAGIALSSSTYAWFVSNNTVTAETATISAMSNAPFLMIEKGSLLNADSKTSITYLEVGSSATLYPSQVISSNGAATFESAYAKISSAATELTGSRYTVGSAGTAVTEKFAITEQFVIGVTDEKAGSFKDLKVDKVDVTAGETDDGLKDAICVLLVCGDQYAVYKAGTGPLDKYNDNVEAAINLLGLSTDTTSKVVLQDVIDKDNSAIVDAYVFYDGSAEKVYTTNLANLTDCGVTITFTATPVNTQGVAVNATNQVTE